MSIEVEGGKAITCSWYTERKNLKESQAVEMSDLEQRCNATATSEKRWAAASVISAVASAAAIAFDADTVAIVGAITTVYTIGRASQDYLSGKILNQLKATTTTLHRTQRGFLDMQESYYQSCRALMDARADASAQPMYRSSNAGSSNAG